jgi:hypothetical protein
VKPATSLWTSCPGVPSGKRRGGRGVARVALPGEGCEDSA